MTRLLPGSSDPPARELHRLQQQCDRVRAGSLLQSCDSQDEGTIAQIVIKIPTSRIGSATSPARSRFSNPQLVGVGAFGMVFSCDDADQKGERVAIKILRPSRQHDRIAKERFQEETRVMTSLDHPNIVKVFGTGEIDQLPYMITEFADEGSIATLLANEPDRFSPRQAAWIVSKIASAVAEAHATLILHRDIKPGNILLRSDSQQHTEGLRLWPVLTDFGLSKNLSPQSMNPLTFEGEVLGTLSYMSPEQVCGQTTKTQSDLFPLGIILHELAHGKHPFLAENDFATRSNIVHAHPSRSQGPTRQVPAPLDAIIAKCLQKKPEDRYLHATDLVQDLNHFLNGEPISVSPPTPWQSLVHWVGRHRIASTFFGTIFCSIIAIILLLNREWHIEWELAHASRLLAEDRAKVSELFLKSMRATNTGINDSIIAGQRVLPTALLDTLDRQIPLLEEALSLSPDDRLLIRQLEIMYHYKSLCHFFAAGQISNAERRNDYLESVHARQKSLKYIERLLQKDPMAENLRMSQVNGMYFMSNLLQSEPEMRKQWKAMLSLGIEKAESFLRDYPDHRDMIETANKLRLDRCKSLDSESAEECLRLLKEIVDLNTFMLIEDPSRTSLLAYTLEALSSRSRILISLGRDGEGIQEFEKGESLAARFIESWDGNWNVTDVMLAAYVEQCNTWMKAEAPENVVSISERWRRFAESLPKPMNVVLAGHRYADSELVVALPVFYKWMALSQIPDARDELEITGQDLRRLVDSGRNHSDSDFKAWVKWIQGSQYSEVLPKLISQLNDYESNR